MGGDITEPPLQLVELTLEALEPLLEPFEAVVGWGSDRFRRGRHLARLPEELYVAVLLLPRAPREACGKLPWREPVECLADFVERGERVEPVAALLELADRLRAAQHQHRQYRQLVVREVEGLVEQVAILDGAAPSPACET